MPEDIHIKIANVTQGLQEEPQLRVEEDAAMPFTIQNLYLWATGSNAEGRSDVAMFLHTLLWALEGDTGLISLSTYIKFLHSLESPFLNSS